MSGREKPVPATSPFRNPLCVAIHPVKAWKYLHAAYIALAENETALAEAKTKAEANATLYGKAEKDRQDASKRLAEKQAEFKDLQDRYATLSRKSAAETDGRAEAGREIAKLRERLSAGEAANAALAKERDEWKRRHEALDKDSRNQTAVLRKAQADADAAKRNLASLGRDNAALLEKAATAGHRLAQAERSLREKQASLDAALAKVAALEKPGVVEELPDGRTIERGADGRFVVREAPDGV